MNKILFKQGELSDIDENLGIVKGYGSIFGNIDSDNDIIEKGSYRRTIKNNGNRVKYIYNHDITKPIGKMKELYEDEKGLAFVAEVPKTTFGTEILELMKYGVIDENSVGIQPIEKEMGDDGVRRIKEVKLYEISAVTLAANDQARIMEVKGQKEDSDYYTKRFNSLIKIIRKGNLTDSLCYLIEYELEMLKSLIARDKTHQSDDMVQEKSYPKSKKDKTETDSIYNYMFNKF
tara:strand:- start:275 stop:973 length:699 start_codon:yes stop_codon:yes gene_type:complete